jgi:orotidine-5'-phosphate decarboxylase
MSFKARMEKAASAKGSRIILALDLPFESPIDCKKLSAQAESILEAAAPYICAVKFNHHLVLPLGIFNGVKTLVSKAHELGLIAIMDAKVNDIGATNQVIAEYYYAAGFDALIANPFIGWEDGLKPIFEVSRRLERGVILLAYMSHKGAKEGYGQTVIDPESGAKVPQYMMFAKKALGAGADGVVVGATQLERIKEIKAVLADRVSIYSPGVGAQGGSAQEAFRAGASYLIVGREITMAENPAEAARKLLLSTKMV